jgi:predicted nucleotidyltransferase component of viral defense system
MAEIRLEENKPKFKDLINALAGKYPFTTYIIEKDYYLNKLLIAIEEFCQDRLVIKGGTALNKVYLGHYRMSEDLDFISIIKKPLAARKERSKGMDFLRDVLDEICKKSNLVCKDKRGKGANLSTQYFFSFEYDSIITNTKGILTLEVSQRNNPILQPQKKSIDHIFKDPFTDEYLFPAGIVLCLEFKELVAEKTRAMITREEIASRDLFDLQYLYDAKFIFLGKDYIKLLKQKLREDNFSDNLSCYRTNFGRSDEEISRLKGKIEDELFPVISPKQTEEFDIDETLNLFNSIFEKMIKKDKNEKKEKI